jgi:hypothetical protein
MIHKDIVDKVKNILNEHGEVDAVSISEDRVLLEDYINEAIPDAVIMLAQKGYRVNVMSRRDITAEDLVFEDFISLIRISSRYWKKDVTKLTDINSPEYKMSQNPYTKPGPTNPIAYPFLGEGDIIVVPDFVDGTIISVNIIYNAKYDGANLNAEPKEATAVCYMTAALVLGMFGDDQGKQRLSDIATNLLN